MAIYTYFCPKCNRRFDILSGKDALICDICKSSDIKRVWTAPMIKTDKGGGNVSSCSSCIKTTCASCR